MKKSVNRFSMISLMFLGAMSLGMSQTGSEHLLARVHLDQFPSQMKKIHDLDLDVAGVNLPEHTVDLILNDSEVTLLKKNGFQISSLRSLSSRARPSSEYQTSDRMAKTLKGFETAYPDLAKVVVAGKSLEGREILAIKITSHVNVDDQSKSRIFFNGMHHAREVMSNEIPLDTIQTLLAGYGKDTKITHWVDTNEIWVLPMFNVDGNNKVWTSDTMWRKNARGGYGVDINRNYPYAWNSCHGSSSSKTAQDYHGPSAASEPETHVMMDFVKKIRPVFSISYHSYSEIVIYPYGCDGQHTETKEVVEAIGKEMASLIVTDNLKGHYTAGTAPELLYSVDGGDIDWLYHEANVIPYVIEVNSSNQGFQPDYQKWRQQTVDRVRPGWELLLQKMDGSSIKGRVLDSTGKGVAGASIRIVRSGSLPFVQELPVRGDGYFHVILPSGQFQVTANAPGLKSVTESVNVGSTRVDLNVSMK